jgi:hypothetical protein
MVTATVAGDMGTRKPGHVWGFLLEPYNVNAGFLFEDQLLSLVPDASER